MKGQPLVSVIVPCYNVADYIEKAVFSILNQSYRNLEIFLVDDASTDDTLAKLKAFNDKRIKILQFETNTKKIGAVNEALQQTTGEFIAFQDADDWSEAGKIEQQVKQFQLIKDLGICFTKYRHVSHILSVPVRIAQSDSELKDEFLNFGSRKLTQLAPSMCATMMITRYVLNETNGYHPYFAGRVAEDIHWVYRILKKHPGVAIDKPLYNITAREGSLTNMQFAGKNVKAAYTWQLLSKIIHKDVQEHVDLLDPSNSNELKQAELEACEEALVENIRLVGAIRSAFENSTSFRLGKTLLMPYHKLIKWFN